MILAQALSVVSIDVPLREQIESILLECLRKLDNTVACGTSRSVEGRECSFDSRSSKVDEDEEPQAGSCPQANEVEESAVCEALKASQHKASCKSVMMCNDDEDLKIDKGPMQHQRPDDCMQGTSCTAAPYLI